MEEQEIIQHFSHEHPLRRIPNVAGEISWNYWCYGCWRDFLPGDVGYACSINCGDRNCLHEECAKLGKEIRHPVHPSHPLTQVNSLDVDFTWNATCPICDLGFHELGWLIYICSQGCELFIHIGCSGGLVAADDHQVMNHPSHPQHELRYSERSCTFKCDACGTTEKGNSCICSICQYWIHASCATLPNPAHFDHHPHHPLSLAFILPIEYVNYNYACGICSESLKLTNWVYHCQLCRYIVHIKCATNKSYATTSNSIKNKNAVDEEHKHTLTGPISDIYEELIRPFVKRERGEILNPHKDNEIFTPYKFHNHRHPLSFILFSSLPSSHDIKNEEDDDDDDDQRSELTCDGCTMPIHQKKQNPPTSCSSSDGYESGYMSCDKCKYFLHLACFNLPQHLPAHPFHQINDHHLNLQSPYKLTHFSVTCDVCSYYMNGLFYACTNCTFKIDIKCISLPATIQHAGHPHYNLKLVITSNYISSYCHVCQDYRYGGVLFYRCEKCKIRICGECILLPASNKHRLEKHMLPLTFDASVDHPDEFYCANCEEKMNPKSWMYHCRDCDQSFHTQCIPATSGRYRNINFGRQQYQVNYHPQHPLSFQLVSNKKRCDVCHGVAYDEPGYQCTSCNFVMCHSRHEEDVKPID